MTKGWQKGCGLGCAGCGLAVLSVILIVLAMAPGLVDGVRSVIGRQAWFGQWQGPPEGAPVEDVLPDEVAGLYRGNVEAGPGPELLDLEDESLLSAQYRGDQRAVDVWAGRFDEMARDEAFARASFAVDRIDEGFSSRSHIGNVVTVTFGRPRRAASLWWADDWLYVFVAEKSDDLERFPEELLRQVEVQQSEAIIDPAGSLPAEAPDG